MNAKRMIVVVALLAAVGRLAASGPIGMYGIVEKVVFEAVAPGGVARSF